MFRFGESCQDLSVFRSEPAVRCFPARLDSDRSVRANRRPTLAGYKVICPVRVLREPSRAKLLAVTSPDWVLRFSLDRECGMLCT